MNLKEDIAPYQKNDDTPSSLAFKVGFLACIKSIEDKGYSNLSDLLKKELDKI